MPGKTREQQMGTMSKTLDSISDGEDKNSGQISTQDGPSEFSTMKLVS